MFEVGDIVFVANLDKKYEEECPRYHNNFFGKVMEVTAYRQETVVEVDFGNDEVWSFNKTELAHAKSLKDLTLEEFSNKYNVIVTAQYI